MNKGEIIAELQQRLEKDPDGEFVKALDRFLRDKNPWAIEVEEVPIWISVTLGLFDGRWDQLYEKLTAAKFDFKSQDIMREMFRKIDLVRQHIWTRYGTSYYSPYEIDLVTIKPYQLGFKKMPSYRELRKAAMESGFYEYSAEVAPLLWLYHRGEQLPETVCLAMSPVHYHGDDYLIFTWNGQNLGTELLKPHSISNLRDEWLERACLMRRPKISDRDYEHLPKIIRKRLCHK